MLDRCSKKDRVTKETSINLEINLDGTSTLNVYELKNIPVETVVNPSQYVTREEFETVLAQLKEKIAPQASKQPTAQQQESKPKLDF